METYEPRHRDRGLRRTSRVTAWVAGAAVVMVGVLSAYVGHAFPGTRSSSSSTTATVPHSTPTASPEAGAATPATPTPTAATSPPVQVPVRTHASTRAS